MTTEAVHAHLIEQARFCALFGSPFTAQLLDCCAADLAAGGPVAALIGAWPGEPRADALALRLAGALHAAALTGRDGALAAAYPAAAPDWDMACVWPLARAFLTREAAWVRTVLASPPQTNEVRRAIALLPGFLSLAAAFDGPMDLLELGASAGLNLHWDSFGYQGEGWSWNPGGRPLLDTAWSGPPPAVGARVRVRNRAACDQNPLNVADPADVARLRSYIWADQADRLTRFDAAVAVAQAHGVRVDRADAADWLAARLAQRAPDGLTVVFHSIFLQYPPPETQAAIHRAMAVAGAAATPAAPLAWLRFEPETVLTEGRLASHRSIVDLVVWRGEGGGPLRRVLAGADPHGRSVAFDPDAAQLPFSDPTDRA